MSSEGIEGTENIQALLIFSLAEEWRQVLLNHECMFSIHGEYGETIRFPEGTTRTLLYNRGGQATNRYRIQLPDGLELREVLDDEGTGKSWLTLVLSQESMQDTRGMSDILQGKVRRGKATEEQRREARRIAYQIASHGVRQTVADVFLSQGDCPPMLIIFELHMIAGQLEEHATKEADTSMDVQKKQEVYALIEKAEARVGLITVLTRRLESSNDLLASIAAAELRDDPNWLAFTRGVTWYDRRRRKIARRK